MRNRISAIIIDPHKNDHDYNQVIFNNDEVYGFIRGEQSFDLNVLSDADNIKSELNKFKGVDCIITIGNIAIEDNIILSNLSYEFRKKWIHIDEFEPRLIARNIISVFLNNIGRERPKEVPLFSIFTCAYKTSNQFIMRLYYSLLRQTYPNWNWFIIDDSKDNITSERFEKLHDPRITVVKNVTNHGNIGFNKHMIAMMCDGDYLVEVDHDDELTNDCLMSLKNAFIKYPDADFAYSHAMEEQYGKEVQYDPGFSYGLGQYKPMMVNDTKIDIAVTSDINCISIRGIHACPNHVRCWSSKFYHKIGGHNPELSVLDDMDLIIRTFLYGKMLKVDKVLYIQHEGESGNNSNQRSTTATSFRFFEIQRCNDLLKIKYDKAIHDRLLELGDTDPIWVSYDNENGYSTMTNDIALHHPNLMIHNYIFTE